MVTVSPLVRHVWFMYAASIVRCDPLFSSSDQRNHATARDPAPPRSVEVEPPESFGRDHPLHDAQQ